MRGPASTVAVDTGTTRALRTGAVVAGQKFYFLKNEGALLELALVQYAMQTLVREGYTPVITPDVARVGTTKSIRHVALAITDGRTSLRTTRRTIELLSRIR